MVLMLPTVSAVYYIPIEGQLMDISGNLLSGEHNVTIVLYNSSDVVFNRTYINITLDTNSRYFEYINTTEIFSDYNYTIRTAINDDTLSDKDMIGEIPIAITARGLSPDRNIDLGDYNLTANYWDNITIDSTQVIGYFSPTSNESLSNLFLNLSGTNANQDMNISPYKLEAQELDITQDIRIESAYAGIQFAIEQLSAGQDAAMSFDVEGGVPEFSMGVDNSIPQDPFCISEYGTLNPTYHHICFYRDVVATSRINFTDDVLEGIDYIDDDLEVIGYINSTTNISAEEAYILDGRIIHSWDEVNASGGNSNETLWAMFANITNIMNNGTIYDMINAVSDNDTNTWNSNESINNFIDNGSIVRNVNESFVRNLLSGISGIVYDSSTGQILATATNDTNDMNNQTIWDMVDNETFPRLNGDNTFLDSLYVLGDIWVGGIVNSTDFYSTDATINGSADYYGNITIFKTLVGDTIAFQVNNTGNGYFSGDLLVDGNVGVGTTTPGRKLEVVGDFNTTDAYIGDNLNVTGNAAFQEDVEINKGLGINTDSGGYTLNVNGYSKFENYLDIDGNWIGDNFNSKFVAKNLSGDVFNDGAQFFHLGTAGLTDYGWEWSTYTSNVIADSVMYLNKSGALHLPISGFTVDDTGDVRIANGSVNLSSTGNVIATGMMLEGRKITSWDSLNGSSDGIGNSNETLLSMFMNISGGKFTGDVEVGHNLTILGTGNLTGGGYACFDASGKIYFSTEVCG